MNEAKEKTVLIFFLSVAGAAFAAFCTIAILFFAGWERGKVIVPSYVLFWLGIACATIFFVLGALSVVFRIKRGR